MDKEVREQFRSIQASMNLWGALLLATVSFLGFHLDKSQEIFWGIVSFVASCFVIVLAVKDVWETLKYQKENKKEESKKWVENWRKN